MSSKLSARLRRFSGLKEERNILAQFMASASAEGWKRFSPKFVSQQVKISIEKASAILLKATELGLTTIHYEIECTECGVSDFVLANLGSLIQEERTCKNCDEQYVPSVDSMWVTFDLAKDVAPRKRAPPRTTSPPSANGMSLVELGRIPYFQKDFFPNQIRLDLPRFKKMLLAVKRATTNDLKKTSLENLAEQLLESIPSVKCTDRDRRTSTGELDRIFTVAKLPGTMFQDWETYFAVECKNWESPADAKAVRDFAGKLTDTRMKQGIIFSRQGLTGDANTDAIGVIRNAFVREGVAILVFTLEDMDNISKGANIYHMLEEKFREIRFLP